MSLFPFYAWPVREERRFPRLVWSAPSVLRTPLCLLQWSVHENTVPTCALAPFRAQLSTDIFRAFGKTILDSCETRQTRVTRAKPHHYVVESILDHLAEEPKHFLRVRRVYNILIFCLMQKLVRWSATIIWLYVELHRPSHSFAFFPTGTSSRTTCS
jgi:hypothetical protein